MPPDDLDPLGPCARSSDSGLDSFRSVSNDNSASSPRMRPEPDLSAALRTFLAVSRAYLNAPLPAPAPPPAISLSRGPSSAVLRKRQRAAGANGRCW